MNAENILRRILTMNPKERWEIYPEIEIIFRGYEGLVGRSAYKGEKREKHKTRPKIGLFDILILHNNKPPEQRNILLNAVEQITRKTLIDIYIGGDPENIMCNNQTTLQQIQLLFLEQELNYGEEDFHQRTIFKATRDFFMAYLLKTIELTKKEARKKIELWSNEHGVIWRPPRGKVWEEYILEGEKWLKGEVLELYRKKAKCSDNNPNWFLKS